ncbi:hypothetical protein POF45_22015 [Pseudomonas sp. 681]|uniref:Uncharacterized protein n=1 Tax=Pseudomonas fungipugnans TaxID=3024217 RepID=A0ABT6QT68_9PSED|nr:hypothetical protein [Pseudomonas sp. 681]MDI2594084.1 hypothetical protein [Pseudomonas sp. 681]
MISTELQNIARTALNELEVCKSALFQMEALFFSIKNADTGSVADNLINLGASVTGDIGNLASDNLVNLEARYDKAMSATRNAESENVSRNFSEVTA